MPLAVLLLILWPLAELYVAIKVAEAIGLLLMLLALVASWPLGMWALRRRGAAAWRRLADAVAMGRSPAREVLDGALVLIGGILLLIPGFITDVVGLCVLLPPSRSLLRHLLARNLRNRFVLRAARATRRGRDYDVEGTASTVPPRQLRR